MILRYGIRINPLDWFFFISGHNEGEGYNALILSICKYLKDLISIEPIYILYL